MSRSKRVKVHSFPGATVSGMEDYLKLLIKKRPATIILHCGTNDLSTSQLTQVAEDIRNLVNYIKAEGIDCTVSELVMRNDGLYNKVIEVNEKLTLSGPGGGLRGPDGQTHSCQSETSYPMMPKLGDF